MQRGFFAREELLELVSRVARDVLGDNLVGIVVFGSSIYMGRGRDIDVLVVVREASSPKQVVSWELGILQGLREVLKRVALDIHIVTLDDLRSGAGFVAGLALGYRIALDLGGVEQAIREALEKISREGPVLHNRYGSWDLRLFAEIALRSRKEEAE